MPKCLVYHTLVIALLEYVNAFESSTESSCLKKGSRLKADMPKCLVYHALVIVFWKCVGACLDKYDEKGLRHEYRQCEALTSVAFAALP